MKKTRAWVIRGPRDQKPDMRTLVVSQFERTGVRRGGPRCAYYLIAQPRHGEAFPRSALG